MLCQNCGQNEADTSFELYYDGKRHTVHVCSVCVEKYRQYAGVMYENYMQGRRDSADWRVQAAARGRVLGESPFPGEAGGAVRRQRQLNALRAKLCDAIEKEFYEQAAVLRDEIAALEKDVIYCD